jgi:hypothetical protein
MTRIIWPPDRYVQGPGEIGGLHNDGLQLGNAFPVVANSRTLARIRGLEEWALGVGHEEDED